MGRARMRAALAAAIAAAAAACGASTALHERAIEHNRAGIERLQDGDLEGAAAAFRLALEYNARFSEPYNNLALVAMRRGELDEAEGYLRAALRLNPDFAEAWTNLGALLLRRGDAFEAVGALVEAVRADPGQLDARYDLVLALLETGQLDQAWEQVLRLDVASPEDPQVLALAAWVAVRLRRFDEARGWATGALSAAPDSALANLAVGVSLLAEDDAAAAEPFLRAAADADPGPTVSLELGLALLDLEQWAKARAAFDRVLLDDPENAVALAGAGAAAAAAGDVIEAKRLLESALEADAEGTLGRAAQETAASLLEALRGEE